MACYGNTFALAFLLFFAFLSTQNHARVNADSALIKEVCSKGQCGSFCVKCFHSNLQSVNADSMGLGSIMINCTLAQNQLAIDAAIKISQNDPNVGRKEAFAECVPTLNLINERMTTADRFWREGNRKEGIRNTMYAADTLQDCIQKIPDRKLIKEISELRGDLCSCTDVLVGAS